MVYHSAMLNKRNQARKYFQEGKFKEAFCICKGWKDLFGDNVKHIQRAYEIMVGNSIYKEMGISLDVELPIAKELFKRNLLDNIIEK